MAGPALARLRIELEADSASLEKGLKDAQSALQRAAAVGVAVGAVIAEVAVQIAAAFSNAVGEVISGIQEVNTAAGKLDMTVEELSRLRHAAESVGVGFDSLSEGLQTLAGKIAEAARNANTEAARAFEAMGVAIRDAEGDVLSVQEVFGQIADRFRGYTDSAERATLATALFGDKGQELARVAALGSEEMDRLAGASDRAGQTIGRQSAHAVEALAQAGNDAAMAMRGLAQELLAHVAPHLLTLTDYFRQAHENSTLLRSAITLLSGAFRVLVDALISVDGVLREIGNLITGVFTALRALLSGDLAAAGEALATMWGNVGKAWREATAAITSLHAGIAATWQTTVQFAGTDIAPRFLSTAEAARQAAERLKMFREEMQNALSDPTVSLTEKLAAIQVALQEGAITFERYQRAVRQAFEINAKAMEGTLQTVGQALTAIFNKSKPAAIAAALINTYVGITQALRSLPPPWSYVQAAAIGAMGFAQVRNIQSTSSSGGGGAPSAPAPSAGDAGGTPSQLLTVQGLDPGSLITGASMRDLAERLLAFQADGGTVVFQ